jgi:hypothetical protein
MGGVGLPRCSHPGSIPGELVTPRILRHAPSDYILVTKRAQMMWEVKGAEKMADP